MKKNFLLFVLSMSVMSCQEMTEEQGSVPSEFAVQQKFFFYGNNGMVFPGDGLLKPVFKDGERKGTFSVFPQEGMALNPETGEINVTEKTPAYNYLIRFVDANGKSMLQTVVSVAGVRYPSRFFDISLKEDEIAQPIWDSLPGQSFKATDFRIENAELDMFVPDTKSRTLYKPFTPTNPDGMIGALKEKAINPQNGDLDMRAVVANVFGARSGVGGKIALTIGYQLNGKDAHTTYVLYRENIKNPAYRKMLRDWMNMDMVIEAKQQELIRERKVGPIHVPQRWGQGSLGMAPAPAPSIFQFVSAAQSFPPPNSQAVLEGENDE